MPILNSAPVRFTPRGLTDAFDATDEFPGACRRLSNLVFDQFNPEEIVARPGVGTGITSFAGFTTPGFVSIQQTIGNYIFGMVATGLTAGYDEPFCWDLVAGAFIAITGVTSGNAEGRPASPTTSGAWTPPTMAVIGSKIIITHPGYTGSGSNFFGVIDISTPSAPAYTTANTATNALPSVPLGVANFGNRAYFICKNAVYYSDVLVPTTMTNAGQALTVGDSSNIIALSGLPIQTTTAGVVGALIVFKGSQIWQITGDAAITNSLALNYISLEIGTQAARSVAQSPMGIAFAGPDGPYVVNPLGAVVPITDGQRSIPDLRQPFAYVTEPTRVAASFAGNIYRICVPTIIDGVSGTWDYWFDLFRRRWNGPHSFVYDCASSAGNYFILSSASATGMLFKSETYSTTSTTFDDNGVGYNVDLKTSTFPKRGDMAMKQVVESTIELSSSGASVTYGIAAFDGGGNQIGQATIVTPQSGGIWGSTVWGDGTKWSSSLNPAVTYAINWTSPLVFNRMAFEVTCPAAESISIGSFFARYQLTRYLLQT